MKKWLIYLLLSCIILGIWQYFGSTSNTARLLLSSPSLVISYFIQNHFDLLQATYTTLLEAVSGLAIAICFSFSMMVLCFYRPKLMDYILPIMITSQVIPLIVLAPFFIVLMGIGLSSKIAMAALISFFPIFINFAQGYKSISKNIHELMMVYQAPLKFRIKNVYFPLSMPSILAGLKISANLAVIGAIVAEFSGAENGLGKNLYISAIRLEPELMMSSLFLSMFIGIFFYSLFVIIERRIVRWI